MKAFHPKIKKFLQRKKHNTIVYSIALTMLLIASILPDGYSQSFEIATVPTFTNNNGSGGASFNIHNNNSYDIRLVEVEGIIGTSSATSLFELYLRNDTINGNVGTINAANGWNLVASNTFPGVGNTTTTTLQSFMSNMNIIIPANSSRGVVVFASTQRYFTIANNTYEAFTTNGVRLQFGQNISYGGNTPPTAGTNNPRGWLGKMHFEVVGSTGFPNDASVAALTAPADFCAGPQMVSVRVTNMGNNILNSATVNWSVNGVTQTPVTMNTPLDTPGSAGINSTIVNLGNYTFPAATANIVAWTSNPNGTTDPNPGNDTLHTSVHPSLSGTYTINSAVATGGINYQSFNDFTTALNTYGVCGPVIANVVSGSGPYTETVTFNNIVGSSATNYIRVNGNGALVQFNCTASERQLLTLDGAKHVRIDSLIFKSQNTTYGWGARITGGAAYDSITRCQFDLSTVTSTTAANVNGIIFSASTTSATGAGVNGTKVYIANNYIKGSGAAGGLNYGIGIASGGSDSNSIKNNLIENFYNNGIYIASARFTFVESNEIHKANKTAGIVAGEGIHTVTGDMSGSKIIGNRIHSPGGTAGSTTVFRGLSLLGDGTATDPVVVANNVIYKINQGGASSGIYVSTGTYNLIYHNTISFDQVMSGTTVNYGIYTTGVNTGTDIVNNLVSITAGTGGIKYGFYHATANGINDAQKNNFYLNSTQPGVQNYGYYTTAYATQAAFQTAYPTLELGSPAVDPQFTAPATGNFLPANAAVQNAGNNLSTIVPTDINGIPRAALPTIGAFESLPSNINDAAAMTLLSPQGLFCSGSRPVEVVIRNAGANNINTVQVNWSVNGIVQTPFAYSGVLVPSTATTGQNMDTLLLGNATLINGANTINVWTSLPNGVTDTDISNDSVNTSLSTTNFTVNALSDTVCANTAGTITLSPAAGYVNETITWESSADGLTWTNIAGASTPVLSLTGLSTTTYFRAKVTNSGITCNTASEEVTVISPAITASTPAERCGPGTLTLSATPLGGVVNWYSAATGGSPLYTGTSFTTPNISNTTTYYAAAATGTSGGNIPELMYYKFDIPGTTVPNEASNPVGTNPAPVTGLTIGGTGQFGTGLQGNAGATATNRVNPGWTGTHTGSWTISFWMNVPTPPTTRYMFGNSSGNGTFRCFIGGAAQGIRLTGGVPSITLDMPNWNATGPKVITYVYDQLAGTVSGYVNGVFQVSATPGANYPLVGTNFLVGSQGTSIEGTMDEFRMYSRALTAAEVASLWNTSLSAGCESTRTPVVATINPIPDVALGNDTAICPDGSLTLDATLSGTHTYLWHNGAVTPTINVTTSGTYSVSVSNGTCTGYDTIIVNSAPVPTAILADSASVCDGLSITLDAGNNGADYLWSDGSNNQTLELHTGGLYTVDITNTSGCSITDSTFVTIKTIPEVDLGNDTIICIGSILTLDAQNSGADYLWSTGDQTQSVTVIGEGSYSVTVTNAQQCSASDTIEVSTYEAAAVNGFHFTPRFDQEAGRVDFVPIDPMFVNSYHWDFGDGNTSNDPAPSNVFASSGNYLVTLTVTNDCGSKDTSLLINVDLFVGVKNAGNTGLNIDVFPVPATDYVTIESKDAGLALQKATVTNMAGQTLAAPYQTKGNRLELDLGTLTSGNYTIIVQTNKGIFYRKINILK